MKVIGLTGGIATGKSTVARLLRDEHGATVIDADQVSREVVEPGQPALAAIVEAFGPQILLPDGAMDRAAVRELVMSDASKRSTLESITHPAIRQRVAERIAEAFGAGAAIVVVEAALLVETGGYRMYPELVVVSCDPETQVRRVMARDGGTEQAARQVLAAQLPMADKEAVATHVIRNDGSLDELRQHVSALWKRVSS